MSKLPEENRFVDLSDYGRPVAILIANALKNTMVTPIHLTISFIVAGLIAVVCLLNGYNLLTAIFLVLKSILDAADGELARVKETPSYTGRYFDSIADIFLNAIILLAIWSLTEASIWLCLFSFIGIQLQGTLYNYYYVILRNRSDGDTTSRVFETSPPKALPGESQKNVNYLFGIYTLLYGLFDRIIFFLDTTASKGVDLPKWFMTLVSSLGLGSQLLIIAVMLVLGKVDYILPFFIFYSVLIFVFICSRKLFIFQP